VGRPEPDFVRGGDVGIVRRFTSPKGDAAGEAWLDADRSFIAGDGITGVHERTVPERSRPRFNNSRNRDELP
jgi:hypothetical protein